MLLTVLFLSGCVTSAHVFVNGKPSITPLVLSAKLSERYSEIGIRPDYTIGRTKEWIGTWMWWDKPNGGFIGHRERDGMLWIWIMPGRGLGGAREIADKIVRLLSEIAPDAKVQIHEYTEPDLR